MTNAISHHLIDPTIHALVLIDGQPREALYRTVYDDKTEEETVHILYMEEGEVRSVLAGECQQPAARAIATTTTFDALIGRDVSGLPTAAASFLESIGAVDSSGQVQRPT